MINHQPNEDNIPISVNIVVSERRGIPCIELRRVVQNSDVIKQIVSCAFYEKPIIMLPVFKNKFGSLSSLVEKGILIKKEENYFFL